MENVLPWGRQRRLLAGVLAAIIAIVVAVTLVLCAKTPIERGEIVAVKGGYVFSRDEWARLASELGPAEIEITDDLVMAPARADERSSAMLYTNHSCDPNVAIQGQIVLVAMR